MSARLDEIQSAQVNVVEWQNRRSGIENLGKFFLPFVAVVISIASFIAARGGF